MSIQPVPDALAGEKMICADFFNLENGATVFMVTGALSGQQIHVLLDTGAGLSFISEVPRAGDRGSLSRPLMRGATC